MTKQLKPRNLDIKITKITAKTVYYELTGNGKTEDWRVPDNSTFNKNDLQVGVRYQVTTRVICGWQWDGNKRVLADTYDWVTATPVPPKARLAARTAKQRKASEVAASMPLVDTGELISW
jgi:hypothetical protein